jgi:hypothetical protein
LGLQKEFLLEEGASFKAEFRVHFIEEYSAYSFRLAATAPFDIEIGKNLKPTTAKPKTTKERKKQPTRNASSIGSVVD